MTIATVLMPETIKIESKEAITLDNFLKLLYLNKEDVEDYIDVSKAIKKTDSKFYNFDDIINEY
jgi:hypothetical protein